MKSIFTDLDAFKNAEWEKTEGDREGFISHSFNGDSGAVLRDLTGINTDTLATLEIKYHWVAMYFKREDKYVFYVELWVDNFMRYSDEDSFDSDVLGLFEGENIEEEKDPKEKLIESINKFCSGTSRGNFIDLLRDDMPGLWEDITDVIREDEDEEDTAKQWIDDNNGAAIDYVFSNCDTYDMKDYVIDYIRDNL